MTKRLREDMDVSTCPFSPELADAVADHLREWWPTLLIDRSGMGWHNEVAEDALNAVIGFCVDRGVAVTVTAAGQVVYEEGVSGG